MFSGDRSVAASLFYTSWGDLSENHKELRQTLEDRIQKFPKPLRPLYIVGAIGSGKTQLLHHAFRYSWREAKTPALCVILSQLLNDVIDEADVDLQTEQLTQAEIYGSIETVCRRELDTLAERVDKDEKVDESNYIPDAPSDKKTASAYFADVLERDPDNVDLDSLADTVRNDKFLLLVDELEETYKRMENVVEGHQGPLREVVDKIDQGVSSFNLICAFGYASIQELGQAENRRTETLHLPTIKPESIQDILGDEYPRSKLNLAWWISRGRPGWLSKVEEVDIETGEIEGLYDLLDELLPGQISNVDLLAAQPLEEQMSSMRASEEARDLLTYLILMPGPVQIDEFDDPNSIYKVLENNRELPVLSHEKLASLGSILDLLQEDIRGMQLYEQYDEPSRTLRQYMKRALSGIADDNGRIVFGDTLSSLPRRGNQFRDLLAVPVAERAHDTALEELPENSSDLEFLYQLSQTLGRLNADELDENLRKSIDKFSKGQRDVSDIECLSISPKILTVVFPSLITNPIVNFQGLSLGRSGQLEALATKLPKIAHSQRRLKQFGTMLGGDPR